VVSTSYDIVNDYYVFSSTIGVLEEGYDDESTSIEAIWAGSFKSTSFGSGTDYFTSLFSMTSYWFISTSCFFSSGIFNASLSLISSLCINTFGSLI